MDQIITFNKTFHDRLEELTVVFDGVKLLPACQIHKQWAIYLELEINASGWQAFWKIPRLTCMKLNIPCSTVVLVHVCDVNYEEFNALVEVIAVQGELNLTCNVFTTSLTKLWPTKQQATTVIDAETLADAIDKLRFFYNHIFIPWNFNNNNIQEYQNDGNNLEERLRFYFDVKQGIIPKNKTIKIRALLSEIHNELENYENEIECFKNMSTESEKLSDLHFKIIELQSEIELLQITLSNNNNVPPIKENKFWLIFKAKNNLNEYITYLESVKYLIGVETCYKAAVSLQNAVENANQNDTIIVSPGQHVIKSPEVLEEGIILKSIQNDRSLTIVESNNEKCLLEFFGDQLLIENVTINVPKSRCAIITHCGQIIIKNCQISGGTTSEHGIIAMAGAQIYLENCNITGFNVGMYASDYSIIKMQNCCINNVSKAFKLFDNTNLYLNNCTFYNCNENIIYLETTQKSHKETHGDVSLLKPISNINISECVFDAAPVVVIANKPEDVFNNVTC